MRIGCYNIEWFSDLFGKGSNRLKTDPESVGRLESIRDVLGVVDADVIGIVEAPNTLADRSEDTTTRLEAFASWAGLRTSRAITGFISGGRQELAVMWDPAIVSVEHTPGGSGVRNPPFDGTFEFDTDEDRIKEIYRFYRPPLEVEIEDRASGAKVSAVLVHTKSKGIFNAADLVHWERENLRNRRKLLAETQWVRLRVDEWLDSGNHVVVMGDINDGPGMDHYEFQFAKSAVENIVGDLYAPQELLVSHIGKPKWTSKGWVPYSTSFKDRITEVEVRVLIDHVLASQGLEVSADRPHRVWAPDLEDEAHDVKNQLRDASDHFPVTLDLELG